MVTEQDIQAKDRADKKAVSTASQEMPSTAPSSQPVSSVQAVRQALGNIKIAHISDLHFGFKFNKDMWLELCRAVRSIHPHAIIVTGDLVNSPFWWSLRRALNGLTSLRRQVAEGQDREPRLFVIPGNHDTRIWGILPVIWVTPSLIAMIVATALVSIIGWHTELMRIFVAVAAGLLLLRWICLRKFTNYFASLIPQLPELVPDLGIVLYPFDSATRAVIAAGGVIPLSQFSKARAEDGRRSLLEASAPYFRLALLHHHALPIPYDSARESMMVLKNAGAFLSEAARLGIRLVINGHKHHHHFSRVTINGESISGDTELCVLATGTPTAGRQPDSFGYNFNLLEIDPRGHARVTRYHAEGGTFISNEPFWLESVEATGKALFRENSRLKQCRCNSLAMRVNIDADGDGRRDLEYRRFRYIGQDSIDALPGEVRVDLGSGHIERLEVHGEPGAASKEPYLDLSYRTARVQRGRIVLPDRITDRDPSFNFSWGYDAINAFAMSENQFRKMYPQQSTAPPLEYVNFTLLYIPVGEATIQINLPEGFGFEGAPTLDVIDSSGSHDVRLEEAYRRNVVFNPQTNMIFVRMSYPPLNSTYRVQWKLSKKPPPAGRGVQSLTGRAREVSDKLLRLANSKIRNSSLVTLLESVDQVAREELGLRPREEDPLGLSIMAFDEIAGKLRIAAANCAVEDAHLDLAIDYGDGIAGRAYKMNRIRLFVKSRAIVNGTPFYYIPYDGRALSADGREVLEEAILSMPLSHPEQPDTIFGILNISSRKMSSRLVDVSEDQITTEFRRAVSKACFDAVDDLK